MFQLELVTLRSLFALSTLKKPNKQQNKTTKKSFPMSSCPLTLLVENSYIALEAFIHHAGEKEKRMACFKRIVRFGL